MRRVRGAGPARGLPWRAARGAATVVRLSFFRVPAAPHRVRRLSRPPRRPARRPGSPSRRPPAGSVVELLGVVGPGGARGVSTGRGWELELTVAPWRPAPPAGPLPDTTATAAGAAAGAADGGVSLRDPEAVRTGPLRVRGPVAPEEVESLVADLTPGRTVRVAAAVVRPEPHGDEPPAAPWARLDEIVGVEPPDDRLEGAGP